MAPFIRTSAAALLALAGGALAQGPLTTAFTYQGELRTGGGPASGPHDLRFRLYDAPTGGAQLGSTLCADNVSLAAGRFTIQLDFGSQFAGQQRYLEIEVRADTGLDCSNAAGFTLLNPRQPLTAAPNSLFALNTAAAASAANATQLNGQSAGFYTNAANLTGTLPAASLSGPYTGALTLSNASNSFTGSGAGLVNLNAGSLSSGSVPDARLSANIPRLNSSNAFGAFNNSFLGSVGVGTASPAALLHVKGAAEGIRIDGDAVGGPNSAYLSFRDSAGTRIGYVGDGSSGDTGVFLAADTGDVALLTNVGIRSLVVKPSGDVGIGTTAPAARLDALTTGATVLHAATSSTSTTAAGVFGELTATFGAGLQSAAVLGVNHGNIHGGAGVWGKQDAYGWGVLGESALGTGVFGRLLDGTVPGYGVYGAANANGYAVYAEGRFAASGTKAFRIDHPADPEHKYLMHYCSEGPDPLNVYTGKIALDDRGEAVVDLPPYFAAINKDPRYSLTALGAAMPLLHIDGEIDDAALVAGAAAAPGEPIPACSFRIAGGVPGARVSWRIDAVRNDRFVQQHGAPVESDKPSPEHPVDPGAHPSASAPH